MVIDELLKCGKDGEAAIVLSYLLNRSIPSLLAAPTISVDAEIQTEFFRIMKRREEGLPLQYAIGRWNFYGRDFFVDERALIPRPETEGLAELALNRRSGVQIVLDLCTGSGILAITLALELPEAHVWATDLSEDALALAEKNCGAWGTKNVTFRKGDLFEAVEDRIGTFDLVVSNPPYVKEAEYETLEAELHREPPMAFLAGEDGLEFYRRIAKEGIRYVKPGGLLAMEIGAEQGADVCALLEAHGWKNVVLHRDLSNRDRIVEGVSPGFL